MTIAVDLGRKANKQTNNQTASKITASENVRRIEISREANIVDPYQTAPTGAVCSGFTLFI